MDKKIKAGWDRFSKTQQYGEIISRYQYVLEHFHKCENHKHLDIGCAKGLLIKKLKDYGVDVYGIDAGKNNVEFCRSIGLNVIEGDALSLPYTDGFFDSVSCLDVIEHVISKDKLLFEINRVLKHGGILFLTFPNGIWPRNWFRRFLNTDQPIDKPPTVLGVEILLKKSGFSKIHLMGYDFRIDSISWRFPNFAKPFEEIISNFPCLGRNIFLSVKKIRDLK